MSEQYRTMVFVAAIAFFAVVSLAQTTPVGGLKAPDDTASIKIGSTIFADYTYNESPTTMDADSNTIHSSSFNVSRAYVNVTGNLNHRIAFRITPDIARESGSGSSLAGSYTFRLKYGFGQLNLDDWTTKGSWIRFGLQQTPLIDHEEAVYRYRFQGPVFVDREGFLTSSDAGLSGHWSFPADYGDVHAGFYNGEGYSKAEANDEKTFQVRATLHPLPRQGIARGLRLTAFRDEDHYVRDAKRTRTVAQVTFEHPLVHTGVDYLNAIDRTSAAKSAVHAHGYSIWVTPRFGKSGWEVLLRHDSLQPDDSTSRRRTRNIAGIAYWFPNTNRTQAALLADYDALTQTKFSPARPDDRRYGLKMLISF